MTLARSMYQTNCLIFTHTIVPIGIQTSEEATLSFIQYCFLRFFVDAMSIEVKALAYYCTPISIAASIIELSPLDHNSLYNRTSVLESSHVC